MAESRTRKRTPARSERTVGQRRGGEPWRPVFFASVIAVIVSVIVLLVVAADSLGRDAAPPPGGAPGGAVETPAPSPGNGNGASPTAAATAAPTERPTPGADGTIVVACGDILAPLDKQHRLPADCEPPDLVQLPAEISFGGAQYLRREALDALLELFEAARRDGFSLVVNSSYRSYDVQAQTYATWVQLYGQEYADRTSARPGHSEHQLGTTADVGARGLVLENFVGTPEAAWLEANSWKYGFIVSYPDGKEHITGYAYEPWHIRYVGKEVAADVHRSGLTLREYLLQR
ncbi:M15 family metallopeptidase [Tepidiforma flava]|uniref:M15 family metallopeptidase n=1 Tax=Tepidiforma flava TaxID=3004094 RepID=A0ABY7M7Q3_9CHLR|nr:M15 family metallopeptidase [Tepidiforma flava]WBL35658.1 M15 family metallopeptidase [Tepidiforma flava]